MTDYVSGGNVKGPITAFNQLNSRARLSMLTPFLLPLLLLGIGLRLLLEASGKGLSSKVTSSATELTLRLVNPDSGGNTGQAISYLAFGTSLFLLYGFMVLPFFVKRFRISPRLSFLIAVSVGFMLLLISFYVKPPSTAPLDVQRWGQTQLQINDLPTYTTAKDGISQTFTVTNTAKKKVTFGMSSRTTGDYLFTTYTVIK